MTEPAYGDDYEPTMTHWFGTAWPSPELPAPVCDDPRRHIDTPVGEPCYVCTHAISAGDQGVRMPYYSGQPGGAEWSYAHLRCFLRDVLGLMERVAGHTPE